MSFEVSLRKYARLILEVGLNIQPGDKIALDVSEEMIPLVRILSEEAYKLGVYGLKMSFSDDAVTLSRFRHAPLEALRYFPEFEVTAMLEAFKEGYHRLSLYAPNPELLKDIDPERIQIDQLTRSAGSKPVMEVVTENKVKWCVAAVPCKAWAASVFPDLSEEEALEKLWKKVFEATRVTQDDPVAAWKAHEANLKKYQQLLNEAAFEKLIYQGPGTDLEVYLTQGHAWIGGSSVSPKGSLHGQYPHGRDLHDAACRDLLQ